MRKYVMPALSISVIAWGTYILAPSGWFHAFMPGVIGFFLAQSLLISWLFYESEKNRQYMPVFFLGGVAVRFITAVLLLIVFAVSNVPEVKSLMIQFSVLYLVFMTFEMSVALANLRRN